MIKNILKDLINNNSNYSFNDIIDKNITKEYVNEKMNIVNLVEKELTNNDYEIICINPLRIEKK